MKRRGFLKRLGIIGAATIVASSIVIKEASEPKKVEGLTGISHQMGKGRVVSYEGLTRDHIKEAVEYIFNQPVVADRQIKFNCGRESYEHFNILLKYNEF